MKTLNKDLGPLTIVEILKTQQNKSPLLFLDKIINVIPGKSAKGLKNFTYNEWFFPVHYEDDPNVPGFIQVETLVQTFIMTFLTLPENKGKKTNFLDIKDFKFRKKIIPGDCLIIDAELHSFKRGLAKGLARGFVENDIACYGEFYCSLPDEWEKFVPKKKTILR